MQALLFPVGRETVIGDLEWRQLTAPDGLTPKKEKAEVAERLAARYAVEWPMPGSATVVGYVRPRAGADGKRAVSAAAWLAAASPDKVIYVDEVAPGKVWLLIAGAGRIDLRGDRVLPIEEGEDILNHVLDDAKDHEAATPFRLVSPKPITLNVPMLSRVTTTILSFGELVGGTPATAKLRPQQVVGFSPVVWLGVVAAIALVAAAIGVWRYVAHLEEEAEVARRAQAAEQNRLAAERIKTLTDARIVEAVARELANDTETLDPNALLRLCLGAFDRIGTHPAGWRVLGVKCDPSGGATAELERPLALSGGGGTNVTLWRFAETTTGTKPGFRADGRGATLSIPVSTPDRRPALKPLDLPRRAEIDLKLGTRFQMVEMASTEFRADLSEPSAKNVTFLDPAKEATHSGTDRFSQVPDERSYRQGRFQLRGRNLWELTDVSLEFPWISITNVEFRPADSGVDWTVEGYYVHGKG